MPRDTSMPANPQVVVLPSSGQRLRFKVRGLQGSPALAGWLLRTTELGDRMRASSATGVVSVIAAPAESERCVRTLQASAAMFGPVDRDLRTAPPARPARTRKPRRPAQRAVPHVGSDAHAIELTKLLARIGADGDGLSAAEAELRLQRDGRNKILELRRRSRADILLEQFRSVPVALLATSGAAAFAMRAYAEASAIGAVLGLNGALGYWTESRAEQTVDSLAKLAPRRAVVIRDGREMEITATEVVVGDLLALKPGVAVAADARVIDAHRLSTNEAALTGESLPVSKAPAGPLPKAAPLAERGNMVHMGTVVSGGAGRAIVVATGPRTALGAIRALVQDAPPLRTRLQGELDGLGKRLALGAAAACGGLFALGLLRGRAAGPMLRTAVSLGVASIPEGLPTVATSLLASSIRTLQKRNVFVRRLDAIENLGAVDVVCIDKTGTLTENRMRVSSLAIGDKVGSVSSVATPLPPEWLQVAALCCDVERRRGQWQGSPTEVAIVRFAEEQGANVQALRRRMPRSAAKQRSEHHPYMVTLHPDSGRQTFVAVKGRPQELLQRCSHWHDGVRVARLSDAQRRRLLAFNDRLAARGQRVLALAYRRQRGPALDRTERLTWLGMLGLSDPLRNGIEESIARFRAAGIRPLMLTGDQPHTAEAIAREAGLVRDDHVLDAGRLPERARQLQRHVDHAAGFARTSPAMKLEIVKALQQRGHVVAMAGDGINDGPALKIADVGVAMGKSGTDFAHAMSDLVLQDDHPDGLLDAIAEGRTGYLNVKKAVQYLVSTNVSEMMVMAATVAAGLDDPLDPMALLWTNLITDVTPAIALGLEPPEPDILQRPPFARKVALLEGRDWQRLMADSGLIAGATLAAYLYGLWRYGAGPRARTLAFMSITNAQLLYALSARSEAPLTGLSRPRLQSNPWLSRTVVLSLLAQWATLFPPLRGLLRTAPLGLIDLAIVLTTAAAPTLASEALKRRRIARPSTEDR